MHKAGLVCLLATSVSPKIRLAALSTVGMASAMMLERLGTWTSARGFDDTATVLSIETFASMTP